MGVALRAASCNAQQEDCRIQINSHLNLGRQDACPENVLSPLGDASDLTSRGHLETLGQWDYTGLEQ